MKDKRKSIYEEERLKAKRKYEAEIADLKRKNSILLNANINLRTECSTLRKEVYRLNNQRTTSFDDLIGYLVKAMG